MASALRNADLNLIPMLDALLREVSVSRAAQRVGVTTPAMSHALARLRTQLGDPLLIRSGRHMVLSARAEALGPQVASLVESVHRVMMPAPPRNLAEIARTLRIGASDYVLLLLGQEVDRLATAQAPRMVLRFVPNTPRDAALLREGEIDLAVGVYGGELPPELRTQTLFDERLVCVVREGHPGVRRQLSLRRFAQLSHIQVAPRGRAGGVVDDALARAGLERRVSRAVPYFLSAFHLVAESDHVLTAPERIARALAPRFGLRILRPPLELAPHAITQIWHPRHDEEPAHRWLRGAVVAAAKQSRQRG
ncbi:MAG: LysR family transcriptional regulator [Sandaracinaceae bacterium]|nr:LysR family transcriptional regulator [Sandaracinaceae bacterium]